MKHFAKSGAVLAAAALSFAVTGVTLQTAQADDAKVHCIGVNACKGQSECKSGSHSCKGLNACKGQGFLSTTRAECDAQGGKVEG
jgi:uncharacterized membrane protein